MRVFLLGFMGAGKTYWGKQLAEHLQLPFYDLDEVIVEREGMSVSDIFAAKGEDAFRQMEKDALRELVAEQDKFVISCGGGTPCFHDNITFMNEKGTTIWLNPAVETMVERLKRKRGKRPLLQDLTDEELLAFVEKKLMARAPVYEQAKVVITSEDITLDTFDKHLKDA
ncbi:shikimate kinase [Chitinophaga horti]|uniref:Shikimate kinase n=1 Tax=Chitinophaga horti TaxID=2920382 RepID=A0ABY6J3H2_9BACT|nr:shikimate kinase [Chitinophaga horti]UYQ94220.1 shikimate kinase [Chitinophaga horti]